MEVNGVSEKKLLDVNDMKRALTRMTYEILERNHGTENLAIVGIKTRGEVLAKWIQGRLYELEGIEVPFGVLDISGYRDDQDGVRDVKISKDASDMNFDVNNKHIFIVDDVLMTGRTVRSAMDALIDYGRPSKMSLVTLIDRGHRELPIRPDIVGKNIPTNIKESVHVYVPSIDEKTGVFLSQ